MHMHSTRCGPQFPQTHNYRQDLPCLAASTARTSGRRVGRQQAVMSRRPISQIPRHASSQYHIPQHASSPTQATILLETQTPLACNAAPPCPAVMCTFPILLLAFRGAHNQGIRFPVISCQMLKKCASPEPGWCRRRGPSSAVAATAAGSAARPAAPAASRWASPPPPLPPQLLMYC